MKPLLFIFTFLIVYIIGGRKISIPYSIAVLRNIWLTIVFIFLLDMLQVLLYYFLLYLAINKVKWVANFLKKQEKRLKTHRVWKHAREYGKIGIFILASLPSFGGGILSSMLLSFVLRIDKKVSFLLIAIGSLLGISLLAFLSSSIFSLF